MRIWACTKRSSGDTMKQRNKEYSVDELRAMLKGVTWEAFLIKGALRINGISFDFKMGTHFRRPCIAVTAKGHFIAFRHWPLGHHLFESDNVWTRELYINCSHRRLTKLDAWGEGGYFLGELNDVWRKFLIELVGGTEVIQDAKAENT